jgi:2,3-dihydroxybiphenyl 1,2-dioxygenase
VFGGLELAYICLEVPEPPVLDPFLGDVVGLVSGPPSATGMTWRNDDRVQRVLVEAGPKNDATCLGFEVPNPERLASAVDRLRTAGFEVDEASSAAAEARHVASLVRTTAPWGIDIELVLDLAPADARFESALVPGGFLTEGVGFGHVVFATTDLSGSHRFVTEGLGLRQSDWLAMEIAEGIELEVRFYHCNARHHSLALARAPFELPQALHHIMFETCDIDDVGAAFERAREAGVAIASGLGKHDNDEMFSFYAVSPAGFQVEVGHGARVVTDDWSENRRYDRMSRWGHQPLSPSSP